MRFVYVLTSDETDFYYEECLISILSLLKHNPDAEIILLTDNKTADTLTGFRAEIKKYTAKIIVEDYQDSVSKKIRSRLLKTSMRRLVTGRFLYLDTDTVIAEPLYELENSGISLGMVLDKHVQISEHYMYMYMYMYHNAQKMGYSIGYQDCHFNSGVIWVGEEKCVYDFFELWGLLYQETLSKGIEIDQTSLNEVNARLGGAVSEMDGIWNVQINCGLKYLYHGKILHYLGYQPVNVQNIYFNTLPFLLCEESAFQEMREKEKITENIAGIIDNPKTAFKTVTIIPEDCVAYRLIFSNHMRVLKFLYVKCRKLYRIFEWIYGRLFLLIFERV